MAKKQKLTKQEKSISEGIAKGEWRELRGKELAAMKELAEQSVRATLARKEARTNVRLEKADMDALRKKAEARGVGYQTLIASIIHMYVRDELLEAGEVRKMLKLGLVTDKAG